MVVFRFVLWSSSIKLSERSPLTGHEKSQTRGSQFGKDIAIQNFSGGEKKERKETLNPRCQIRIVLGC